MRAFNRLYPVSSDLESDLLMSEGEMLAIFTAPLRQSAARLTPAQHCHLPRLETLERGGEWCTVSGLDSTINTVYTILQTSTLLQNN